MCMWLSLITSLLAYHLRFERRRQLTLLQPAPVDVVEEVTLADVLMLAHRGAHACTGVLLHQLCPFNGLATLPQQFGAANKPCSAD